MTTLVALHEVHLTKTPGTREPFLPPQVQVIKPGESFECTSEQADDLLRLGAAVLSEVQTPEPVVPEKAKRGAKPAAAAASAESSQPSPAAGGASPDTSGDDMV